ncbi:hypothetical protein [Wolbachia endosymbiont of Litomosoides brasiliensis]|nr:hypothetical protein [Wolbachia endosymbiont of Litomosoides brasiliensis]
MLIGQISDIVELFNCRGEIINLYKALSSKAIVLQTLLRKMFFIYN